jgi:prepilin signal peptidase PulO-like enzyme (type II secretory pathway)
MDGESSGGSTPDPVESIEHQLTRKEVVPVFYWQVLRGRQSYILPVAGICLVIVGVVVLETDPGNNVAWTVLPSLGIVALLIFYVIVPLAPGRIWKGVGSQFEMRTLEVSE